MRLFNRSSLAIFVILGAIGLLSITLINKQSSFCANSISCIKNLNVEVDNNSEALFNGQKISPPKIDLALDTPKTQVLGDETASGEKHIYVDLTNQTLYAYQGTNLFMKTLVSTGKWHPTPTGEFNIWIKLRSTRMTGGTGADFYDLPNVPYVMFFAGSGVSASAGFSLHGAYWHNNFGHPMSHGCVNMRPIDAQKIFDWADAPVAQNQGTKITIYGQAPI